MEIRPDDRPEEPQAATEGSTKADRGTDRGLKDQLREAQAKLTEAEARNEDLAREVGELTVKLRRAHSCVRELWSDQCALSVESDRQLVQAELEIEQLRNQLSSRSVIVLVVL